MKRVILMFCIALSAGVAVADEGMWTLYNLPQAVYNQMKQEGIQMGYDDLYNSDLALKNAVVDFCDFCSGVVVSDEGLLFTNHHCGFGFINQASTVEHDYMRDGFVARYKEMEIPCPDAFVKFMIKQEDVTDKVLVEKFKKMSAEEQQDFVMELQQQLTDEARKQDESYTVMVQPFFERNQWVATTYQVFEDVRLVFTAPKSLGKFGGETDNWMWPRQTCDFSVFRIYADAKTNAPAKYSEENVPYRPKRYSKVSLDGYKDGDYAMIMGYPGSTSRYISSYGIIQRRDIQNAAMIDCRKGELDILRDAMANDQALRIRYEKQFASTANYYKNSLGMNTCIDSIGLIEQKQEYERKVQQFIAESGYLKGQLDFAKMKKLYAQQASVQKAWCYYRETLNKCFNFSDSTRSMAVEKAISVAAIKKCMENVDKRYLPKTLLSIQKNYGGDVEKFVDAVAADTVLCEKVKDSFLTVRKNIVAERNEKAEAVQKQEQLLTAAILRMEQDSPHYSDANFTMRLTYGQVGEYNMAGGKPSGYYTTAESMVEKMRQGDKIDDYTVQPELIPLMDKKDFGHYTDKTTGKMHLCFLTNNDITGGNSGSPVFGDKGQLLGLAFDGNWEALASDILFDSVLARTICVDARYMLYIMDKWGHADNLINELTRFKEGSID